MGRRVATCRAVAKLDRSFVGVENVEFVEFCVWTSMNIRASLTQTNMWGQELRSWLWMISGATGNGFNRIDILIRNPFPCDCSILFVRIVVARVRHYHQDR